MGFVSPSPRLPVQFLRKIRVDACAALNASEGAPPSDRRRGWSAGGSRVSVDQKSDRRECRPSPEVTPGRAYRSASNILLATMRLIAGTRPGMRPGEFHPNGWSLHEQDSAARHRSIGTVPPPFHRGGHVRDGARRPDGGCLHRAARRWQPGQLHRRRQAHRPDHREAGRLRLQRGPGRAPACCAVCPKVEVQLTLQDLFQLDEPPAVDSIPERHQARAASGRSPPSRTCRISTCAPTWPSRRRSGRSSWRTRRAGQRCSAASRRPTIARALRAALRQAGVSKAALGRGGERSGRAGERGRAGQEDAFRFVIEGAADLAQLPVQDRGRLGRLADVDLDAASSSRRGCRSRCGAGPRAQRCSSGPESGELDSEAGLRAVAEEMVGDERTQVFFNALLQAVADLRAAPRPVNPDASFTPALLEDMIAESELVLGEHAFTPRRRLLRRAHREPSYVTPALGKFYGLEVPGGGVSRVEFPAGHHRANTGLLTHASLISAKNDGDLIAVARPVAPGGLPPARRSRSPRGSSSSWRASSPA